MHIFRLKARALVLATAASLTITMMVPLASYASSKGDRNTAIGLAGVAAYLLVKGKTLPGIAAAAGAGYAYSRSQNERRDDRYRDSRYRSDRRSEQYRDNRDWQRASYYQGPARYQCRDSRQSYDSYRDSSRHYTDYGRGQAYGGYRH